MLNHNIKTKLKEYFVGHLGFYDYRRGWLKGDCPYCGEHKFGVNLTMNRSNCFKCGSHPQPIEIVLEVEGFKTKGQVFNYLGTFEGLDFKEEIIKPHELKTDVKLPDGYINIRRGDSQLGKAARKYVKKRGFDVNKMSMAGWGYGTEGKYLGYLIMPFYINGKLVYYNARKFFGDGPKFNNPLIEDFGLGKNMLVYNVDALDIYKTIWAVESIMNAETIGDHAIGLGGKKISNYQINLILKSPVQKVIIGLDSDAIDDAVKLALRICRYKSVKIVRFPNGKDINDLGRKRTLVRSYRENYLKYNDILKLKFSLPT